MLMGIDSTGGHGTIHHIDPAAPKKSLLEAMFATSAKPMFVDTDDGSKQIGYVVSNGRGCAPSWVTLYEVSPWEAK